MSKSILQETTAEDMQTTLNTNLMGPMYMIQVSRRESVKRLNIAFVGAAVCTLNELCFFLLTRLLLVIIRSSCLSFVQPWRPVKYPGCPAGKRPSSASPHFWVRCKLSKTHIPSSLPSPTASARWETTCQHWLTNLLLKGLISHSLSETPHPSPWMTRHLLYPLLFSSPLRLVWTCWHCVLQRSWRRTRSCFLCCTLAGCAPTWVERRWIQKRYCRGDIQLLMIRLLY